MRVYSLTELFCTTRAELFSLHAQIVAELPSLSAAEHAAALDGLCKIRRVLAHPIFAPP